MLLGDSPKLHDATSMADAQHHQTPRLRNMYCKVLTRTQTATLPSSRTLCRLSHSTHPDPQMLPTTLCALCRLLHTIATMWWIKDLFYRPVFRIVAPIVVVAVAALAFFLFSGNSDDVTTNNPGTPQAASSEQGPGGQAGTNATSASAKTCRESFTAMSEVVQRVPDSATLQPADRTEFAIQLVRSRAQCTFREYANFENNVLREWTGGISVDALFENEITAAKGTS